MEVPQASIFVGLAAQPGREAKENIIFFVAQHSTLLSAGLAEGTQGLRRLAAARCSIRALPNILYKTPLKYLQKQLIIKSS